MHKFGSVFVSETMIAVTPDRSGSNLPATDAPWRLENRSFGIGPDAPHRFGYGSSKEIRAAIEKEGFWCRSTKCVTISIDMRSVA
jgi:hypothetical protein